MLKIKEKVDLRNWRLRQAWSKKVLKYSQTKAPKNCLKAAFQLWAPHITFLRSIIKKLKKVINNHKILKLRLNQKSLRIFSCWIMLIRSKNRKKIKNRVRRHFFKNRKSRVQELKSQVPHLKMKHWRPWATKRQWLGAPKNQRKMFK